MPPVERSTTLEAVPLSAGFARRFVAQVLADWRLGDVVDTAELLVSELVTNVVLHAHTDIEVVARLDEASVRIEVRDASSVLPTTANHHRESQTGRGLELVDLCADSWGVAVHQGGDGVEGKSVWFCLSITTPSGNGGGVARRTRAAGTGPPVSSVCLLGVPTALYRSSEEHRQGLTREFVLMVLNDPVPADVPARLVALAEELSQRFARDSASALEQVEAAELRGDATVDLLLHLAPMEAGPIQAFADVLEEADEFCEREAMLTMPATAEVRAFRRWCADQVVAQLAGRPGTPWRMS